MQLSFIAKAAFALAALAGAACAQADVQHIVAFRYQAGVTADTRADIARRFVALKNVARRDGRAYIVDIKTGKAISREGMDQGFEEVFVVTFRDTADRDYFVGQPYRPAMDPDHEAVARVAEPLLARDAAGKRSGLFVFDFDDGVQRP
ncbi:Dabb family protein [Ramlibacter sp.]|uniref:Dabb family protein n=1 Tax=Ramlibacter sp. TaxID=1917967 RepID=UPI0018280083|nr:Dabb family protein [Ramlibacter sp.]MBA2674832.1 Dabb family protein [Ramlibacter sp.]